MTDPYAGAVVGAINSMNKAKPKNLLTVANFLLDQEDDSLAPLSEADLVEMVTTGDVNDDPRPQFHIQLATWDSVDDSPAWAGGTKAGSAERRAVVLAALGFGAEAAAKITEAIPLTNVVVISNDLTDWDPWYPTDKQPFYWNGYANMLQSKGWGPAAISSLSAASDQIVKRLAEPTRAEPYQSKGLVVGHVQSGKTANFTGVIAKAIDSGYKLVIVLTGTIELLRSQTQRRLDMELIGRQNILGGIDENDPDLVARVDYLSTGDQDWLDGKFLSHPVAPETLGLPAIKRLTRAKDDYKFLKAGLDALDFRANKELQEPALPLYDPKNIDRPDVRFLVVKKNAIVLKKLVADLKSIKTDLSEIPALIIDDEADQASVNTTKPSTTEQKKRTAINRLIAELLRELKRAQYVGYTATPFANVFVDPDDVEDVFPKDFIVSLDPPENYMGGRDFHDLDGITADDGFGNRVEPTVANSNEMAFVRPLVADPDDVPARNAELQGALDAFVLSGAIKLFRSAQYADAGKNVAFRHHTMLAHESRLQADHATLADEIRAQWRRAGYDLPVGMKRLHDLWTSDFAPVTEARAPQEPAIPDFRALRPYIGHAIDKIQEGVNPVVIVNGAAEKDYVQDDIDFQSKGVWKILVGGAKLSRGFTVEGLTISFYTRRTTAADTLMQMGRWFGYRPHYRDLVRLYIGRQVPLTAAKKTYVDLYDAFEAIVRDEEDFREELQRFQGFDDDGRPKVRPMDVPPLVYQTLPWLRPTAANKMYNAKLTEQGDGGKVIDFNQLGKHDDTKNIAHFNAVLPLLDATTSSGDFFYVNAVGNPSPWTARYGVVSAEVLLGVIRKFRFTDNFKMGPYLAFMQKAITEGTLKDWAVIVPDLKGLQHRTVEDRDITLMRRHRRDDRQEQFSGSSNKQRDPLKAISGGIYNVGGDPTGAIADALDLPQYAHVKDLYTPTRGAFLLTFAADSSSALYKADDRPGTDPAKLPNPTKPKDVATLFSYALPRESAPGGRIAFGVERQDQPDAVVVDADPKG